MDFGISRIAAEQYSAPSPNTATSHAEGQAQLAERRELLQAVKELEKTPVAGDGNELRLALDRETKRPVVRIVNRETGELIQQFPAEEVLRLAQRLKATR